MTSQEAIQRLQKCFPLLEARKLLSPSWRKMNEQSGIPSTGFCYIASEALFHMIGDKNRTFTPRVASYKIGETWWGESITATHWWLEDDWGKILDPTADQFEPLFPPYELGKYCPFLTGYQNMSHKAKILMGLARGVEL
jgi:hypothetical protein